MPMDNFPRICPLLESWVSFPNGQGDFECRSRKKGNGQGPQPEGTGQTGWRICEEPQPKQVVLAQIWQKIQDFINRSLGSGQRV